jgi:hypothetical protein
MLWYACCHGSIFAAAELKVDGFPGLPYSERGRPAQLVSRNGTIFRQFDALAQAGASKLKVATPRATARSLRRRAGRSL